VSLFAAGPTATRTYEQINSNVTPANIKSCAPSQDSSIGQVVRTIFKFEDGTLTLATIGEDAEEL
jgi:hypothetical protein